MRTEFAFVITARPSAPCASADLAPAESETSTMNEMPSPSAMAWLNLLTGRDRSRRGANREAYHASHPGHAPPSPPPRWAAARDRRGRRARGDRDAGQRPAPRDAAGRRAPRVGRE